MPMNRKSLVFILAFMMFLVSYQVPNTPGPVQVFVPDTQGKVLAQDIDDIDALILIGDFFGWNFFDVRDILLGWGADVTIVTGGATLTVPSCLNRPSSPITAGYLLSTFDLNTIDNYDILFVPAGGQWQALSISSAVDDLVIAAQTAGLVIASICIGHRVIITPGEWEGLKVAHYTQSVVQWTSAGAIPVTGMFSVSDSQLVTGGGGGGLTEGGYTVAPTSETCAMAAKAALGRSFVETCTVTPSSSGAGTTFSVSIETTDPAAGIIGLTSTTIDSMEACFYLQGSNTSAHTIPLTDTDSDGTYTGSVSVSAAGEYNVAIEVTDSDQTLEVVRNAASVTVLLPQLPLEMILLIGGALGAVVVVIAVVFFLRRR